MSEKQPLNEQDEFDGQIIDVDTAHGPKRHRLPRWILPIVLIAILIAFSRGISIYVENLWFNSLGYSAVYWTGLKYLVALFIIFTVGTVAILRGAFWLLERSFKLSALVPRRVFINNQPVLVNPARLLKPVAWVVSVVVGLLVGISMSDSWLTFALWNNRPATMESDPIFGKPLSFYLFALPLAELLSSWLMTLAFLIFIAASLFALIGLVQAGNVRRSNKSSALAAPGPAHVAVPVTLALLLVSIAIRVYLVRFTYLFQDKQIFSGVSYTEDHYLLPAIVIVAIALLVAALILLVNAFTAQRVAGVIGAIALPVVVFIVACVLIPGYVQNFIVKPNELEREAPYIRHNIAATRRAFKLENIEARDFPADTTPESYALAQNRPTLSNLRLWDYHALQDTLRQLQEIRTYYDFNDVDVDRYQLGGQNRQVLLAARELDVNKLPASSQGNWINERLIYTHGYGVTMNTADGFTPEGRPQFILSNMPTESTSPDIQVTRPQIYFGEKTDTLVYVNTKQKEFDYPQGDANASTTYQGSGGFPVGSGLRRWALAWELGDTSRLPFADDVTAESRVLMRRRITDRVQTIAPFLTYDSDPYIVVTKDGRLFWLIDAYTRTDSYPYSRHYDLAGDSANYIRNSVKVTVDAYNGDVAFYVFDSADPILSAYRNVFPNLFRSSATMPEDLRAHVRYPEAMLRTQADAYGLYHTDDAKVFFQREDMWTLAREAAPKDQNRAEARPLEPYYALLQLPGHNGAATSPLTEFVNVAVFTPASRDNLIGWMAGRGDGDAYGSLLVYRFPASKLVNGPVQVNARIDQDPQLSSQLTLWNQQGSQVQRGNLLIIPLGRGLLYVQTIYLQAVRSPMPELRLVVLATQERLTYGTTFAEALKNLFGDSGTIAAPQQTGSKEQPPAQGTQPSQPTEEPAVNELIKRAAQDLADYQRLTAEGKLGEAGQKLESLKRNLDEVQKRQP